MLAVWAHQAEEVVGEIPRPPMVVGAAAVVVSLLQSVEAAVVEVVGVEEDHLLSQRVAALKSENMDSIPDHRDAVDGLTKAPGNPWPPCAWKWPSQV